MLLKAGILSLPLRCRHSLSPTPQLGSRQKDTPYRVEYYVEQVTGKYTLQRLDETKRGITGSTVGVETLFDDSYLVKTAYPFKDITVTVKP